MDLSFPLVDEPAPAAIGRGGTPSSGQEEGKSEKGDVAKETKLFRETRRWNFI